MWNPCWPGVKPATSATIFTPPSTLVNVTVPDTLLPFVGESTATAFVTDSACAETTATAIIDATTRIPAFITLPPVICWVTVLNLARRPPRLKLFAELIVLPHGLVDLPGARHTRRKCDQIAFAKPHRLSALRRYRDIAFQQVARFLLIVAPRKLRHFLFPNGPGEHARLSESVGIRTLFHDNVGHIIASFY